MLNTTSSRIVAFVAALVLAGGAAAGIGAATQATPPFQDCLKVAAANAGFGSESMADAGHGAQPMIEAVPGSDGLRTHLAGLRLAPLSDTLEAGAPTRWQFQLLGCDENPVRHFDRENGKLLHLIVVRSDFTGYQHLHPTLQPDGTFTIDLRVLRPGSYRAITDFAIDGRKYVLATDLQVPGPASVTALPPPALKNSSDGYDVELQRPAHLTAGQEAQLTFRITRHGQPVQGLEPYLGSFGHLVALRSPDVAYSHVHPVSADPARGGDHIYHRARAAWRLQAVPAVPGPRARAHGRLHPNDLLNVKRERTIR